MTPSVQSFFDDDTRTVSYVVWHESGPQCAVIDPVLDFDPAAGRTSTDSADQLLNWVADCNLQIAWVLDTHVHADHLSAMEYVRQKAGAKTAIGAHVVDVQGLFGPIFDAGLDFNVDGSQFDRLLADGEELEIGALTLRAMHTPGHTPGCMSYCIGDAVFVGDTLFMPDYGTARCDFPGGDAATLYRSIRKLYDLPDETRMFLCHDYLSENRDQHRWETTVGEQRKTNVHVREGVSEAEYVEFRNARDATLDMPTLILPSVQVNMRAGRLPQPHDNGIRYLKIPLNTLGVSS